MRAIAPSLLLLPLAACGAGEEDLSSTSVEVQGAPLASMGLEPEPQPQLEPEPRPEPLTRQGPAPPAPAEDQEDGEPLWIDWDRLSGFDYEMLDLDQVLTLQEGGALPDLEERFPLEVIELAGRDVELEGFMIPFEYDDRGIVSFTLVRDQAQCCFGASPQLNHWIEVRMRGDERSEPFGMDPIFVRGTLQVGEAVEDGYVTSIYRVTADQVEAAW